MKVLHVIPAVARRYGGPSRTIVELSRNLAEQKVDVLVAATDADGQGRLSVSLSQVVEYDGIPMIFFHRQCSEAFKYSRPLKLWLASNVRRFDLVHIHAVFSHSSLAAASAARHAGVPYIVRPLGSLLPWGLRQRKLTKTILWYLSVWKMLARASAIHCTSAVEKMHVEAHIRKNIGFVAPIGIDEPSVTDCRDSLVLPFDSSAHPYVLFLGRLHQVKGLELLIESFVKIVNEPEFSHWRLVIAGDGKPDYVRSLKNLVHKLGGGEQVVFVGWLDETRKPHVLKSACLLAQPSYQENFGTAAFEALAYGTPVLVSSQMDLAGEIELHGAGWITDLEPRCVLANLREAMCDGDGRMARGIAGRKLVREQYSWNRAASNVAEQYQRILASSLKHK